MDINVFMLRYYFNYKIMFVIKIVQIYLGLKYE